MAEGLRWAEVPLVAHERLLSLLDGRHASHPLVLVTPSGHPLRHPLPPSLPTPPVSPRSAAVSLPPLCPPTPALPPPRPSSRAGRSPAARIPSASSRRRRAASPASFPSSSATRAPPPPTRPRSRPTWYSSTVVAATSRVPMRAPTVRRSVPRPRASVAVTSGGRVRGGKLLVVWKPLMRQPHPRASRPFRISMQAFASFIPTTVTRTCRREGDTHARARALAGRAAGTSNFGRSARW